MDTVPFYIFFYIHEFLQIPFSLTHSFNLRFEVSSLFWVLCGTTCSPLHFVTISSTPWDLSIEGRHFPMQIEHRSDQISIYIIQQLIILHHYPSFLTFRAPLTSKYFEDTYSSSYIVASLDDGENGIGSFRYISFKSQSFIIFIEQQLLIHRFLLLSFDHVGRRIPPSGKRRSSRRQQHNNNIIGISIQSIL